MATAGGSVIAGAMPNERIATDVQTADSANFVAETIVQTVVAALVIGRTYRVRVYSHGNSSVGTDEANWRIREDNVAGTELTIDKVLVNGSTTAGMKIVMEVEYTALATGNKTFVFTGVRSAGSGNNFMEAAASRPSYFYVDYVYG